MRKFPLKKLLSGLRLTILAFPLTVVACLIVALAASAVYTIDVSLFKVPVETFGTWTNILFTAIFAAPLTLGLNFLSRGISYSSRVISYFVLAFVLFLFYAFLPNVQDDYYIRHSIMIGAANAAAWIFATYAPFVRKNDNNGLWNFAFSFWIRIGLTIAFAIVLFLGLLAALSAFNLLIYEYSFYEDSIFFAWLFAASIFSPLFFLSNVHEIFAKTAMKTVPISYPVLLKYLSKFLLTPFATLYLLILYVYGAKIVLTRVWPEGFVSSLILAFCLIGLVTVLLLYPLMQVLEEKWTQKAWKWFFPAVIPLLFLLGTALYIRIDEYGVTEMRYFGVAIGLWLMVVCLYFIFSKKQDLRFIPVTLLIGCVVGAIGPLSAANVSLESQMGRLENLLMEAGVLKDGLIVQQDSKMANASESEVESIIRYIASNHSLEPMRALFRPEVLGSDITIKTFYKVLALGGYVAHARPSFKIVGKPSRYYSLDVSGYSTWMNVGTYCSEYGSCREDIYDGQIHVFEDQTLTVLRNEKVVLQISLEDVLRSLISKYGMPEFDIEVVKEDMTFEVEGGKIIFASIMLRRLEGKMDVAMYNANILLK